MTLFDIVLILIIAMFGVAGFRSGALRTIGSVVGFIVGLTIANRYYGDIANWAAPMIGGQLLLAKVIVYPLLVVVISKVIGLAFWLVGKIFGFIPLLGTFNLVIGAFIGILEATLILGLALTLLMRYPSISVVTEEVSRSSVAPQLMSAFSRLITLMPAEFQSLDTLDLASWQKVQQQAGERWKEYQNLRGSSGFQKIQELKHYLQ